MEISKKGLDNVKKKLSDFTFYLPFSKSLLNFVVQEIQPKIKVIQSAILESENARKIISENVALIEKRLMPNIPSESETITRVRTELLESLHKSRAKRLNAIVKRQIILKQCEKVKKKLFRIEIILYSTEKIPDFVRQEKIAGNIYFQA